MRGYWKWPTEKPFRLLDLARRRERHRFGQWEYDHEPLQAAVAPAAAAHDANLVKQAAARAAGLKVHIMGGYYGDGDETEVLVGPARRPRRRGARRSATDHAEPAAPNKALMQLLVKDLAGKTVTLDGVTPTNTIGSLVDKFANKTAMAGAELRFVYQGKQLDPEQTVADCGLTRGCPPLHALSRARGGAPERVPNEPSARSSRAKKPTVRFEFGETNSATPAARNKVCPVCQTSTARLVLHHTHRVVQGRVQYLPTKAQREFALRHSASELGRRGMCLVCDNCNTIALPCIEPSSTVIYGTICILMGSEDAPFELRTEASHPTIDCDPALRSPGKRNHFNHFEGLKKAFRNITVNDSTDPDDFELVLNISCEEGLAVFKMCLDAVRQKVSQSDSYNPNPNP